MRNAVKDLIIGVAIVLALCSAAVAQETQTQPGQVPQHTPSVFEQIGNAKGSGPAPKRDLTGVWAGPADSEPREVPPMTPLGQKMFSLNKPEGKYSLANTNDPFGNCDPLGMPRKLFDQTRGVLFAQMPDRVLQLWQYDRVWREIFTDGRELPKNVGARSEDAPDPRWFGYSVGHWDGDYAFVVETTGSIDKSWIDGAGYPHSVDMHVTERYTRTDHDTLNLVVTMEDPKIYTKPFSIQFTELLLPDSDVTEYFCSENEKDGTHLRGN